MDIRIGQPLAAARSALERRTVVGAPLRTFEWDLIEAHIREQSFWSATVEDVRYLEEMKARLVERINVIATGGRSTMDKAKFVAEIQPLAELAGLRPQEAKDGRGGLQDPGSRRRLELIWDIQIGLAEGRARWLAETDPAILPFAPAWEFTRLLPRAEWRDWPQRWLAAGMPAPIGNGGPYGPRMIALKTDPGWAKLSRFGLPWAPFDFGSGMGLRVIRRREARELGILPVVPRGATQPPPVPEPAPVAELPRLTDLGAGHARAALGDMVSADTAKKTISWNGPVVAAAASAMAATKLGDAMPQGMNLGRSGKRFAGVLQGAFTLAGAAVGTLLSTGLISAGNVSAQSQLVIAPEAAAENLSAEELRLFFLMWREAEPETDSSGATWLRLDLGDGRGIAARVRINLAGGIEVLSMEARRARDGDTGTEVAA